MLIYLLGSMPLPLLAAGLPDPVTFSVVIERGDRALASEWLASGLNPDFEGKTIGTGLMIGAWEGNLPMMELFHQHGADVNKTNGLGEQALLHAAWKGRLDAVRWLVEHGARIDRTGKLWSALHYAAFAGRQDVVEFLLAHGANVNALSTNGSTPLMMAAREGHGLIAEDLMSAGAGTEIANEAGETALQWAVRNNNLKIAKRIAGNDFSRLEAALPAATPQLPPMRSQPVPDAVDRLLAQAKRHEAAGRRDEALEVFRAALAAIHELERTKAPAIAKVAGLTISAKRKDPTRQKTGIRYATPAASTPAVAPVAHPAQIHSPLLAVGAADADDIDALLERARALEAAGRRTEALALFRQAAAILRTR